MSERARNLVAGLTVIVALLLLCAMILIFAGLPEAFTSGYRVDMHFPATSDVRENDPVHLAGIRIGKITSIEFTDGDPRKGVTLSALIDRHVRIPADVGAYIYTRGFIGGAYLTLQSDGTQRVDPATGKPMEYIPIDRVATIEGKLKGTGMFPEELMSALKGLSEVAKNINKLFAPPAPAQPTDTQAAAPTTRPAPAETGLMATIAKLNRTLDALHTVLGDVQNQANIKTSLANLAEATARATEAMDAMKAFAASAQKSIEDISVPASSAIRHFDDLAEKLIEDAERISALLATANKAMTKLESGKGTAGKFINDPKLYNSMLEATQQLTSMMREFRLLVEKWKEHGVELKVK